MHERRKVFILLTIKDRQDYLDRQVAFLRNFLRMVDFYWEVHFFDDGSSIPLCDNSNTPGFFLHRSDENLGLIEARNVLVSKIEHNAGYVFFLDDDIFVHNMASFIHEAVNLIDAGYSVVTLPYINLPTFKYEKLSHFKHIFDFSKSDKDAVYFFGGTSIFNLETFRAVGGLEGLYFIYLEEEDMALRLFCRGEKMITLYGGSYIAIHDQAPGKSTLERMVYLLSNRMLFHYKFVDIALVRFFLNLPYVILYLVKSKSLHIVGRSFDRYATNIKLIKKNRIPLRIFARFLVKRYFNL